MRPSTEFGYRDIKPEYPKPSGKFASYRDILEYARLRAMRSHEPRREDWRKAHEQLGNNDLLEALPFFEDEVIEAHSTDRSDLRDIREIIWSIGSKTDLGAKTYLTTAQITRELESSRDTQVFELQSSMWDTETIKETRNEWNNDISALHQGNIEPALGRAEDKVKALDDRLNDFRLQKRRPPDKLIDALKAARAVRTSLLKIYFEPGSLH